MPELIKMNSGYAEVRVERRNKTEHLDYFEHLLPSDEPVPHDKKQIFHLENVAGQLLLASWQPLANQFYSLIFFLLQEPDVYETLVREVRGAFTDKEAVDIDILKTLEFLNGCVQECLRLHQETADGLPRVSPGTVVDGEYIPQGVSCAVFTRVTFN